MSKLIYALLICGLAMTTLVIPVSADYLSHPDSLIVLSDIWVNRDLIESGDMLIHFKYNIPYASPPATDVNDAFFARLYDSSNTIYLGSGVLFPFNDNGYNYGVSSFYFSAEDNPGWGLGYYIRMSESPLWFEDPQEQSFPITSINYSIYTGKSDNQADLKTKLLDITEDLQSDWSITLLDSSDMGQVLSTYGELYYRNAIPNLQNLCPWIFLYQIADHVYTDREWDTDNLTNSLENQWIGSIFEDSYGAIGGLFGVDTQIIGAAIVVILCIIIVSLSVRKTLSINSGLMDSWKVVLVFSLLGLFPIAIACFIDFLAWMYLGYIIIIRR